MTARRLNGEGSIGKRKDGRWAAVITVGKDERVTFYGKSSEEVKAKRDAALDRLKAGKPVRDATMPISTWLAHWRTTTLPASSRKESTQVLYRGLCIKHLEPAPFGAIRLDRLRPSDVDSLVVALRAKGLSASTIRSIYAVLRSAIDGAVRDDLLASNAVAEVKRPSVEYNEAKHLEPAEVEKLLKAAEVSRMWACFRLLSATGMRRGEALALRWTDVDFDEGELHIRGTLRRLGGELVTTAPKTAKSRRTIPLAPKMAALLRQHRTTQLAERLKAGSEWTETGLVFTTESGTAVDPRNLAHRFEGAAKRAGLTGISPHVLRHSFATTALRNGMDIVTLSEILGHANVTITLSIYGHTTSAAKRAAMIAMADAMGV